MNLILPAYQSTGLTSPVLYSWYFFFYHFQNSKNDWSTFTTNMTLIFQKINDYIFHSTHSVEFMLESLHYFRGKRNNKVSLVYHIMSTLSVRYDSVSW